MGSITSRQEWPPKTPKKPVPQWEWKIVDGAKKLVRKTT